MKKIYCLNKISNVGLKVLPSTYEVTTNLDEAKAVLVRSAQMHEMALPESVMAVARAGAGVNNIPLEVYGKEGIVVFNTPGANANGVCELTIAGMLLGARDLFGGMKWVEANKEDADINKTMEKAKSAFAGTELLGKTLGVLGLGAIGSLIVKAAHGLGMSIVTFDSSQKTIDRHKPHLPSDVVYAKTIEEFYHDLDYISVNVPLNDATKGMINKVAFSEMKDGVILLNLARDALVNDDDLKEAIESGKVRKYITDFPNHKTANMSGVVAFPHLGASTEEAEDNCAKMAASQVVEYIENGNLINAVNYPNISLGPKTKDHRLIVLHNSKEGVTSDIMKTVEKKANIKQMVSAEKGDFAITIIDFNDVKGGCENEPCLLHMLSEVNDLIRIRVIH